MKKISKKKYESDGKREICLSVPVANVWPMAVTVRHQGGVRVTSLTRLWEEWKEGREIEEGWEEWKEGREIEGEKRDQMKEWDYEKDT